MSVFSFVRFPALYLSAFITNSFGLALCANAKNKDNLLRGSIAWFSFCIFFFIILAYFDYGTVQDRGFDTTPNLATVITIILAFINYVAIFALFFKSKYHLNNTETIIVSIPGTTATTVINNPPSPVNFAITAVMGVFFTFFVLSLFLEIYAHFAS